MERPESLSPPGCVHICVAHVRTFSRSQYRTHPCRYAAQAECSCASRFVVQVPYVQHAQLHVSIRRSSPALHAILPSFAIPMFPLLSISVHLLAVFPHHLFFESLSLRRGKAPRACRLVCEQRCYAGFYLSMFSCTVRQLREWIFVLTRIHGQTGSRLPEIRKGRLPHFLRLGTAWHLRAATRAPG